MISIMEQPKHSQPQPPVPGPGQPAAPTQNSVSPVTYTDTYGIVSLILAVIAFNLPGFIVGLIGARKAKKLGASPVLSRIGWIVNLIMMIIGLTIASFVVWMIATHGDELKSLRDHNWESSVESEGTKSVSASGYALDVPSSFYDNSSEYPTADIAQGSDDRNVYVMTYSDKAADIAAATTAAGYADTAFESFQSDSNFTGQTRTQLAPGEVPNPNQLDVADYRMEANVGIRHYVYYDRYVKTAKGYYMITTWTTPGELDKNLETMKAILASFHETQL